MVIIRGLKKLMGTLRYKVRALRSKNSYQKIKKTESTRIQMSHMKAQKLIAETLKNADYWRT